ncbi:polysaccharide pyruvyl transferase family protein [Microbacterium luteum]|uniref:polysaccharide pyruvyl transferase family protein n=1 Tax=Microbacterium luteum TaxID=2782167 RepID=UPI0018898331|nr:polysaccharide pyruvyl transferase family protein [Microbacterium luteum]
MSPISTKNTQRPMDFFCSVAAQEDNLGDIEIRAVMLRWLHETDCNVVAYTGSMPVEYIEALDSPRTRYIASAFRFQLLLIRSCMLRNANLMFAPGPQRLGGARAVVKSIMNLLNVFAIRISGGRAATFGRAFRGTGKISKAVERLLVSKLDAAVVRDFESVHVLGKSMIVAPDLAFANPGRYSEMPRVIGLSFRHDAAPRLKEIEGLVSSGRRAGWEFKIVTQVRRDDAHHENLAKTLGIEHVAWGARDHTTQTQRVKDAYSECVLVITNRLHAALFGLAQGAIISTMSDKDLKLLRTLEPWVTPIHLTPGMSTTEWQERLNDAAVSRALSQRDDARVRISSQWELFRSNFRDGAPSTQSESKI